MPTLGAKVKAETKLRKKSASVKKKLKIVFGVHAAEKVIELLPDLKKNPTTRVKVGVIA